MLFKLLWKLFTSLRWVLPILVIGTSGYLLYNNYQVLQQSPIGQFLPKITSNSNPISGVLSLFNPTPPITTTAIPSPTTLPDEIKITTETTKGPVVFTAEVAQTPEKRQAGLMYRTSLAAYHGMYFLFEYPQQYGFWMKNCEIALDMIFIDEKNTIVDIKDNVPPCKTIDPKQENCPAYIPKAPYKAVLELPGGSAKSNNIAIGQTVTVTY